MNDEQLKRELPFDLFGRYAIIRDIINVNRKDAERFKVLDVGGRGNMMKKFLPGDAVFYMDPLVESKDENFIKGDGCAMPLEDESFDWVVSADVFEHIPEEKREDFLKENTRVAKLGAVLAAPFDSAEVRQAEINANENYKILSGGEDYIWLKEHIPNGLPKEKDIENFLKSKGFDFQKLHSSGILVWEILQIINFFMEKNPYENMKKEFGDFNFFYNSEVFPHDSVESSYRKIYFIKKDARLKNLEMKSEPVSDLLFLDIVKRAMDLVGKIDAENKKIIREKDQKISELD
ncbi:MAG: class I SAM-dependent methyltransferase, partial [Candidatus Moranbacteria bacterium]|nr:class I SAM-dependent methyltransferase [Candidatus Moranbacteria bacterium]